MDRAGVLTAYRARVSAGRLSPDAAQEAAAARLDALASALSARSSLFGGRKPVRGLYLWGGVGRGKSMLMDLFFEHARDTARRRVHFHAFMQEVHAGLAQARQSGARDPLAVVTAAIAREARLLCFDEVQVTDIADAMVLGRLLDGLLARGSVIVATSNRPPDDLYRDGINRALFLPFVERLKAELDVVELTAARDYRLERLTGAPVWITPLGPATSAQLEAIFTDLSVCAEPRPLSLTVQGRTLSLPRTCAGIIASDFATLCASALGPADYLAIAAHAQTLILDGVPVLTPARRNEAARFVTLIDALYEARAKLIAAAAAPPDALYPQGDGAFEFQRTVSRLHEMASVEYLGLPHQGLGVAVMAARA
jgi:cell division protein ZapE